MKEEAKAILTRINDGEEQAVTTVIHLSEASNMLKRGMSPDDLATLILGLIMAEDIAVESVSGDLYFAAAELGRELEMDPNDALAVEVMRRNQISEIYSFNADFDNIYGITRLP